MVQTGDIVRFLNDVGGGRVARISGQIAYVEDQDGFETPMPVRECVLIKTAAQALAEAPRPAARPAAPAKGTAAKGAATGSASNAENASAGAKTVGAEPAPAAPQPVQLSAADIAETPDGDVPNIILGFEATDIKRLSVSNYDCSLVNDSNYYLYFVLLSRADGEKEWTLRYDGLVEPNIQLSVATYSAMEVGTMDSLCLQGIAFKRNGGFELQKPFCAVFKVDTTKFFKFHCFRTSPYFDAPAIVFQAVKDGVGANEKPELTEKPATAAAGTASAAPAAENPAAPAVGDNAGEGGRRISPAVRRQLKAKIRADRRDVRIPSPQSFSKPNAAPGDPIEVDLHIDNLLDNHNGMTGSEILNLQVDTFRAVMDANLRNHGQKIIFIHGKGEGVLRQALTKELSHRYKGHDVQDASFRQYGFGATQVTIR